MENHRPKHLSVMTKHVQGASLHVVVWDDIVLAWSVTIENFNKPVDMPTLSCTRQLYVGFSECMRSLSVCTSDDR